jgi:PKD domain-containing protein/Calx-beta domain-containing protein
MSNALHLRIFIISVALFAAAGQTSHAQIAVSSALTPEELVQNIFAGSTAIITNVQYTGALNAIGSFTANNTNLGLKAGIIITTGDIGNVIGPNKDSMTTTENFTTGDPDLDNIHGIYLPVNDAAVLEFDFYSFADRITFEYVFASEEYPEYVGSIYNDTFGFFISGPGYIGNENIALIPGQALSVSINNVNHKANTLWYTDNTNGMTLEYDGFTKVMTAEALVLPCATYHLKLAIGDYGDYRYDSGVFLKAKSFESGSSVYISRVKNAVEGCGLGHFEIVRIGRTLHSITYNYFIEGTAIMGTDYGPLTGQVFFDSDVDTAYVYVEAFNDGFQDEGETVKMVLRNNCGTIVDDATIEIEEAESFSVLAEGDTALCFGTPVQLKATTSGGDGPFGFVWSPGDYYGTSITTYPDSSTTYVVSVVDSSNGCVTTDTILVSIYKLIAFAGGEEFICPNEQVRIGSKAEGGKGPYLYNWEPKLGLSNHQDPSPMAFPKVTTKYVVTVTDLLGCTATDTVEVKVSTLEVTTTGDERICKDGSVRVAALLSGGEPPFKYKWEPALGVSDPTSDAPVFSPEFSTQYVVTVTDADSCTNFDTLTITVDPQLIARAGEDRTVCPQAPILLGRKAFGGFPPYTYQWEPRDDFANSTLEQPLLNPTVTKTYTVIVTDEHGCIATDMVTIHVEQTVKTNAGVDTVICRGQSVEINASIVGGVSPYQFYWSPTEGLDDSLTLSPIAKPLNSTSYILTITDSVGCVSVDTINIIVDELPNVRVFAAGPLEICAPDSAVIYTQAGFARYEWSHGDSTSSVSVWNSGTYGVTAFTADGCVAFSDSVTILVRTLPEITVFGPASACLNSNSLFYYKPAPPGYTYTWQVMGGTVNNQSGNSIQVHWDSLTTGLVSLTISDSRGHCTRTIDYPVEISTSLTPVIRYSGNPIRCMGDSVQLSAGLGYRKYLWSTGDTNSVIVARQSGVYTVTVTDSSGCTGNSDPVELYFTQITVKDISIQGNNMFCNGDSVMLTAPEGFVSYLWSDGREGQIRAASESGDYHVVVTDSIGCTGASNPVTVTKIEVPFQAVNGPTISCVNVNTAYTVTDLPGMIYTWRCIGGTILGDPTAANISVLWTTEGPGKLLLDVEVGGLFCASAYEYPVDIVQNFRFNIEAEGDLTFCSDTGVVLRAPAGFSNYKWSTGETTQTIRVTTSGIFWASIADLEGCEGISDTLQTLSLPSPEAVITSDGSTTICVGDSVILRSEYEHPVYRWSTGEFTREIVVKTNIDITLLVRSDEGCQAISAPVSVTVLERPEPIISGPDQVCEGSTETYTVNPQTGSDYDWSVQGGTIVSASNTNSIQVTWTSVGNGRIQINQTNGGGCSGYAELNAITINPSPVVVLQRNGDILNAGAWVSYQWMRNDLAINGALNQLYTMTQPGTYTVQVVDINGCIGISNPEVFDAFAATTVSIPSIHASPGERVLIPVIVSASTGFLDEAVESYSGVMKIDGSILAPIQNTPIGNIVAGQRFIPISGPKITGNDTLTVLEFVATLGRVATSPIVLESFAWDNNLVVNTPESGTLTIAVCEEGGQRLFDGNGVLRLKQNSPNPYNASTIIEFEVIEFGLTRLIVLDMLGREVTRLVDRIVSPGVYSVYFDASQLSSGSYIYMLQTPTTQLFRTMKLMK